MVEGSIDEPLKDILKQYPYRVNRIHLQNYKKDRGVWWIHTNKGLKVLKKLPCNEDRLKFILDGIIYIQSKGVNIPKIYETIDKDLYIIIDGICYILMDAIKGTSPLFKEDFELKTVIAGMGKFHKASCGFKPSSKSDISSYLGKCSSMYKEKYNVLKNFYNKVHKKVLRTSFEETAIKELPYFFKRIEDIQTELDKSKYDLWVEKVSKSGGLSHSDFSSGNLIITPSRKLYIIDFDSLSIGLPIWDIRRLLFKILSCSSSFSEQHLETVLNWYQSENYLTSDEWYIVKLNLLFPHKVFKIIKRYITKRKNWSEEKYIYELNMAINNEKLMESILKDFDDIINTIT